MVVDINFVGVLVAAVASMVVGFLWYSPILFAKPWMKLMGYSGKNMKSMQKGMGMQYGMSFVSAILTAFVLSLVMNMSKSFFHFDSLSTGFTAAAMVWVGFVAPVQLTDVLFAKKQWQLFYINTGYQLASLLVMGVVLSLI